MVYIVYTQCYVKTTDAPLQHISDSKAPLQGGRGVGDANEGDPWLAQLFQALGGKATENDRDIYTIYISVYELQYNYNIPNIPI